MKLTIDMFVLDAIILELRFTEGYTYWDNCGKIWKSISNFYKNEGIKVKSIDPQKAVLDFSRKDENIQLQFDPEHIAYFMKDPINNYKLLGQTIDKTIGTICENLCINTIQRIGNRINYVLPVESENEANRIISNFSLINMNTELMNKLLGDDVTTKSFIVNMQNEISGYSISVEYGKRILEVKYPKIFKESSNMYSKEQDLIQFSIDCFTCVPIEIETVIASDIIENNLKKVKDNLFGMLGDINE